ncbi:phosphoadenosine phosphosulfate reductase family protein [Pseudorhodoferax sp. Leaf267]|uniref:phosphoadenosine phosphosulfate reductase domain-containing protein n=1 Tax=Pseudorhodoferax sp. Leaf267 TaxID=1736316 RepID=UPI0006FECCC2|nr:phosphoadenosine phosphosulfate reductase family protein [Pseudorhodoferax sp. Leaf267]KQP18371.1 phosphoadenylylsulfate reductase [Pseudorhodoferax sp. Leaf267]
MSQIDLARINTELGRNAPALVDWALGLHQPAILTTNFRPFEAVILHLVTQAKPDVPVVWMDNGYNTEATYRFVDEVTERLKLNLHVYLPRRSRAHREAVEGATPTLDDPRHQAFTEEVKLEPFTRALREMAPKVWFTALRATDTAVRAQMEPVSLNPDGLIKVAPLLHWSSKELHDYCKAHDLPNNFDYVDPTKGEDNRECGLHLSH